MVYITKTKDGIIKNIWDVKSKFNVKEEYADFLNKQATSRNIIINNHWFNIMAKEMFHDHLTDEQYKAATKEWSKFLNQWNIDKFIADKLNGYKLRFEIL